MLTSPGSPSVGTVIPLDTTRDLFAGKLTWSLSPNHTITGSVFGDPGQRVGPIFNISGPESTWNGTEKIGSTDMVARYDGTFGNSFLVRAMYGHHQEKDNFSGAGKSIAQQIDQTVTPNATADGWGFFQDQVFKRDVVKVDLTKFAGAHEFKLGGDYELTNTNSENYQGGAGQRIYKRRTGSTIYYRHRYYVDDLASGFDRNDPTSWQIAAPEISKPKSKGYSAYLQDSWKVTLVLHPEPRRALGAAGRDRPERRLRVQARPELGATSRVRLGRDEERQEQAVRELGPLLREHPAGHQHPLLRR